MENEVAAKLNFKSLTQLTKINLLDAQHKQTLSQLKRKLNNFSHKVQRWLKALRCTDTADVLFHYHFLWKEFSIRAETYLIQFMTSIRVFLFSTLSMNDKRISSTMANREIFLRRLSSRKYFLFKLKVNRKSVFVASQSHIVDRAFSKKFFFLFLFFNVLCFNIWYGQLMTTNRLLQHQIYR